ncbi:hypothetical protein NP493_21g10023 [Ridgeia piscesae]|uniref:Uncharacterized protein n=1 Tax=Ridgeia piscesae TaxID=27915 RepID=A0AAD9UKS1_RIDPI|nr:hypothetical protein NP493_21g10023 [Ridgeia piscesae]
MSVLCLQEAVLVANHATVCGLYPEQPKPATTGCTIRLWTCMSQQEMYLVTYAYLQELKQKVHNSKLIHGAVSNMHIVLERLPDEPRYENVFGTITGTVKVHQHRVEQMAQKDFDPPLSGAWLHSNDFKLDATRLEAYLTYTRSGTMNTKAPSFSPSGLSVNRPSHEINHGYNASQFRRSALSPSGSPVKQPTPVGSVTRGYGGLLHVTQPRQRLGDVSHPRDGSETDNRSHRRTTHWSQPTPSPSPSLPSVLPLVTDFSVPPPAVVPARQLSTQGGATKRAQTAAFRHGGRLDTKRTPAGAVRECDNTHTVHRHE